jgi:hypothetical protein
MSTNSPAPHPVLNEIPVRAAIPTILPVARPEMPVSPAFSAITRDPMAAPTVFDNVRPMNVGPFDSATGGVIVGPAPPSEPSPAVRPLGFDK